MERQELIKRIEQLPPDQLAEVERFVESIASEERFDRDSLHQALADFAIRNAGTDVDLPLTEEYRNSVREIVEDVLEEAGLISAIEDGLKSNSTTRAEIFHILENAR